MSMWMGSQSGGWPGDTNMNRQDKGQAVPQVTLQLDVHPPVLDTCGLKVPRKPYSKSGGGSEKQGGKGAQFWNSLRTVYNSICSVRTPVTWVNPEAVAQHHPLPCQFTPQIPYQCSMERMCEPTSDLWYPVQHARSQFDFLDPLTMWQNPNFIHDILPTPYGTQLPQKVCKPLNPEAKEWVPKEYTKDCLSPISSPSMTTSECLKTEEPVVSFDLQKTDFCEITNSEVEAIRLMENSSLNNIQDGMMLEVEEEGVEVEEEDFFSTTEGFDISSPSETLVVVPSAQVMDSHMAKSCSSPDHGVTEINICDNNMVKDNSPLSYASIVGKMASLPEPSTVPVQKSAQNKVRNGPVEQHIPHIFTSDKKYPKEKAAPSVDNKNSIPPLFKKVTRNQKKCSQNFLKELKESSPVKSKGCGSAVIELDLVCSIPEISSPPKLSSTVTTCPMESPLTALPNDKLKSTELKMPRSCSESSSNGSRHRTTSESSITSVESVDIEFGDDVVDKSCAVINICILPEKIQPRCIESKKYSNNVLAHILGCDDSESEDSDEDSEDSDSDWDNVCVNSTESFDLDDTWETFGLCLPTPEAGKPSKLASSAEENITIGSPVKSSCDTANEEDHTFTGVTLEEINKRWNEDIEKDVLGSRERKVKFGETNIHPIIAWDFAYKMARRGPWEMYARDRMRFQHRIASLEPIISPVLQADHREIFYQKQQSEACCLS